MKMHCQCLTVKDNPTNKAINPNLVIKIYGLFASDTFFIKITGTPSWENHKTNIPRRKKGGIYLIINL